MSIAQDTGAWTHYSREVEQELKQKLDADTGQNRHSEEKEKKELLFKHVPMEADGKPNAPKVAFGCSCNCVVVRNARDAATATSRAAG